MSSRNNRLNSRPRPGPGPGVGDVGDIAAMIAQQASAQPQPQIAAIVPYDNRRFTANIEDVKRPVPLELALYLAKRARGGDEAAAECLAIKGIIIKDNDGVMYWPAEDVAARKAEIERERAAIPNDAEREQAALQRRAADGTLNERDREEVRLAALAREKWAMDALQFGSRDETEAGDAIASDILLPEGVQ